MHSPSVRRPAMRIPALALVILVLVPSLSHAAWPAGGVQVAYPYDRNSEGLLLHDGTGDVVSFVHNTGHSSFWYVARVTPDGDYVAGWDSDGVGLDDPVSKPGFAEATDGSGGVWHVEFLPGNSGSEDVLMERVKPNGSLEPGYPRWNVAATSAYETYPGVALDGAGGTFVAWWRDLGQLYLQRMASTGVVQAGWPAGGKLVLTDYQSASIRPAMLPDGSGGVLVLANGFAGLRLFRVDASGAVPAGWSANGLLLDAGAATAAELIRSDASRVFAVWTVGGRVVSQLVPIAGSGDPGWPGSPLDLFSAAQGASGLNLVADGLGGLHALCRTADNGARWQHFAASGALAAGFTAGGLSPLDGAAVLAPASGGPAGWLFGAAGLDGGLIACWHDGRAGEAGTRARWLRADGTPDPIEPPAGRLIAADASPSTAYVRAALGDGSGGAYVLWSAEANPPFYSFAYLTRAYSSAVLGVRPPPGTPLALAISPNPARESFMARITLANDGAAKLSLRDVSGRLVQSREVRGAGVHLERFDGLDALAPGVYLLSVVEGARSHIARVAVIR